MGKRSRLNILRRKTNHKKRPESVFLVVPNTGEERSDLGHYIEQEMVLSGHSVIPNRQQGKPVDFCRNLTIENFLTDRDAQRCTWYYTIDSDTVPPMIGNKRCPEGALARLLSHHQRDPSKKVLSGVTFSVSHGINWMPAMQEFGSGLWSPDRRVYKQAGYPLVMIDGIGAACMLVHREVIEAVVRQHGVCFRDHYDHLGRRLLGQDLDFCRKIRERGYSIYCDMDVICSHYKTVDIKEYTESMLEHIKIFRMISRALSRHFGSIDRASEALFGVRTTLGALREFVDEGETKTQGRGQDQAEEAARPSTPVAAVDVGSPSPVDPGRIPLYVKEPHGN